MRGPVKLGAPICCWGGSRLTETDPARVAGRLLKLLSPATGGSWTSLWLLLADAMGGRQSRRATRRGSRGLCGRGGASPAERRLRKRAVVLTRAAGLGSGRRAVSLGPIRRPLLRRPGRIPCGEGGPGSGERRRLVSDPSAGVASDTLGAAARPGRRKRLLLGRRDRGLAAAPRKASRTESRPSRGLGSRSAWAPSPAGGRLPPTLRLRASEWLEGGEARDRVTGARPLGEGAAALAVLLVEVAAR